jgi:hypothetical protein
VLGEERLMARHGREEEEELAGKRRSVALTCTERAVENTER